MWDDVWYVACTVTLYLGMTVGPHDGPPASPGPWPPCTQQESCLTRPIDTSQTFSTGKFREIEKGELLAGLATADVTMVTFESLHVLEKVRGAI